MFVKWDFRQGDFKIKNKETKISKIYLAAISIFFNFKNL